MSICAACNRPLTSPTAIAAGVGRVCQSKGKSGAVADTTAAGPRVKLIKDYSDGSRAWMVFTTPKVVVRVTPVDELMNHYRCDLGGTCSDDKCVHKEAVRAAEREREASRRAA